MLWSPIIPSSCSLSYHIFQENSKDGLVCQQKWMIVMNPNVRLFHWLPSIPAACCREGKKIALVKLATPKNRTDKMEYQTTQHQTSMKIRQKHGMV
jgi:hypothetical protein